MAFKKIIVNKFHENGQFRLRMTMTTRKGISAKDFEEAKQIVQKVVESNIGDDKKYTVEWNRVGYPEGYMVSE